MRRKIFAHIVRGPSGGSHMHRPGSEDPHLRERNFFSVLKRGGLTGAGKAGSAFI
jgi:hypothetical protein